MPNDNKKAAPKAEPKEDSTPAVDVRALNIYQKIAAITGEIGLVEKGGQNKEQKYAFIEYAAVAGKLRSLFAKFGVVVVPNMGEATEREITNKWGGTGIHLKLAFTYDVINADKPDDRFTVSWLGEAADYGDKVYNKAATAALKYYLMRQFNISEKGDDADAETPDIASAAPTQEAPAMNNDDLPATGDQITGISKALIVKGVKLPVQRMAILKVLAGGKADDAFFDIRQISRKQHAAIMAKIEAATLEQLLEKIPEFANRSEAQTPAAEIADSEIEDIELPDLPIEE